MLSSLIIDVILAICAAGTFDEMLRVFLNHLRRAGGWDIGHVYLVSVDDGDLLPATIWSVDDGAAFADFREQTMHLTFTPDEGLVGQVMRDQQPRWIEDVHQAESQIGREMGDFQSALLFPVLDNAQVLAVVELFSQTRQPHNPALLEAIATITDALRHLIERQQRSVQHYRRDHLHEQILVTISDTVLMTNDAGQLTYICPNIHIIFGYTDSEIRARFQNVSDLLGSRLITADRLRQVGEVRNLDVQVRDRAGEIHDLLVNVKAVDLGENTMLYTCRDVTEQKHTVQMLLKAEALFQTVVDHLPYSLVIFDRYQRYTFVNSYGLQIIGLTQDAIQGRRMADILSPAINAVVEPILQRTYETRQIQREEVSIILPQGYRSLALTFTPILDATGEVEQVVTISQDMTQRKLQEEALLSAKQLLETVFNQLEEMVILVSLQSRDIIFCNPAVETVLGYTVDEVIGKNTRFMYHDAITYGQIGRALKDTLQKDEFFQGEYPLRHKSGRTIIVEITASPIKSDDSFPNSFVGILRDVTKRRAAETAEREQRILAEALRDTMTVLTSTLKVEEILRRILDSVGQVVPHDAANIQLIHDGHVELVYHQGYEAQYITAIENNTYTLELDSFQFMLASGKPRLVQDTRTANWGQLDGFDWVRSYLGMPLRSRGRVIGFLNLDSATPNFFTSIHAERLAVFADQVAIALENAALFQMTQDYAIELEARVEERTRELYQALEQERELSMLKTRFVSMASHEFRTPLAAILSSSEMIRHYRHQMDESTLERKLQVIHDQVVHLNDLLNDVLTIGQFDANGIMPHQVSTDVADLCQNWLEVLQEQPDFEQQITLQTEGDLQAILIDPKLFRQILGNLVGNAIKYSPPEAPIRVHLQAVSETLLLQVRDEGIGISMGDQSHIFEAFHRGENVGNRSGTGLGLAVARRAAELMGGTITLTSQPGEGSTFLVRLPIKRARL